MFLDAAVLAALAGVSIIYLSERVPKRVKDFFRKNNIAADITAFLVAYTMFGGTIAAVLAGVLLIGVVESLIHVANNADDFLYLWDLKRGLAESVDALKKGLRDYGQEYKATRVTVLEGGRA